MKLTYRGAQYQSETSGQTTVPTEETGTYRGTAHPFRKVECPPTATGFSVLTYRGQTYRSPQYSQPAPAAAPEFAGAAAQEEFSNAIPLAN